MFIELDAILDIISNIQLNVICENMISYDLYYTYEGSEFKLKYNKITKSIKISITN